MPMPSPIGAHTVPWPPEDADRYVAEGYWAGVPLGTLLREAAGRTPDATALVDGGTRLTYSELAGRADALAGRLLDLGLVPGDRIVVQLPNRWEFAVLTWACLRAGIVPVMALPAHRRNELSYLAAHAEAAAIAVPASHRGFDHQALAHALGPGVREATGGPWHVLVAGSGSDLAPGSRDLGALCGPPSDPAAARSRLDALAPASRDVAVFLLSGGTTGLPKLIARTHDDYAYNARASADIADVGASSVYLVSLPAGHNFPLACPGILGTLLAGGTVVMTDSPSPETAFEAIAAEGVTHTAVVPAVAGRWLEHASAAGSAQLASLRVLQVGGARIADELARRIEPVLGARLQQVFGMAEGLLNYTRLDDPADVICGTQGRPLCPADEIRLVDENDQDVPAGAPGSLLTRGPYTPRGYYRAASQNERAFTADGWYRSGDICRLTAEANLIVEGRDKDMINRGGENISAEEVENLLYRIPEVSEVAAVAMPDPALGERVCVYVVVKAGAGLTLERVRSSLEDLGVARYKFPERLVLVPELPATKVGKIDKKALRADIARRLAELEVLVEERHSAQFDALARRRRRRDGRVVERGMGNPPGDVMVGVVQLEQQRLADVHVREVPPAMARLVGEDRPGRLGLRVGDAGDLVRVGQFVDEQQEVRRSLVVGDAAVVQQRQRPVLRRRAERPPQARHDRPPERAVGLGREPGIGPARVDVHVHVGRGRLGAPEIRSGPADHPADHGDVVRTGRPPDQVLRLGNVDVVKLARVIEVSDRAIVLQHREPAGIEAEVTAERPPVRDRDAPGGVPRGGHVRAGSDIEPVPAGLRRDVVQRRRNMSRRNVVHLTTMRLFTRLA